VFTLYADARAICGQSCYSLRAFAYERFVCDCVSIVVGCASGCDTCIMSGAGNCDGPRCEPGYYINSNFLCTSKFSSMISRERWV